MIQQELLRSSRTNTYSDNISVRGSIGGWFGAFLNVGILLLTVEILSKNRQNVANTQRMIGELGQLNDKLSLIIEERRIST